MHYKSHLHLYELMDHNMTYRIAEAIIYATKYCTIISTLQVIITRLRIQVIASVPQRVRVSDGELGGIACCGRCYCQNFAPGAVGVGGDERAGGVGNADNVTHLVGQVEVLGPVVEEPGRVAGVIILEIHGVCPVGLRQDDAIFCCEVRSDAVHRFARSNAAFIVSVAIDIYRSGHCRWRHKSERCR